MTPTIFQRYSSPAGLVVPHCAPVLVHWGIFLWSHCEFAFELLVLEEG
jgi:hypothetical protein